LAKGCLFLAVLGVALLFYGCGGGGPKEVLEVNEQGFLRAQAGLEAMLRLSEKGLPSDAQAAFDRIHDFFHDLDPKLRAQDPALAGNLLEAVEALEAELRKDVPDAQRIAQEGQRALELLGRAATALGFPLPTPAATVTPTP